MMNVNEARRLTKEYFTKETNKHLELIEHDIKQVAGAGGWKCRYANGITGARPEVRDAVMNTLLEKGYEAKWVDSGASIVVCWAEA